MAVSGNTSARWCRACLILAVPIIISSVTAVLSIPNFPLSSLSLPSLAVKTMNRQQKGKKGQSPFIPCLQAEFECENDVVEGAGIFCKAQLIAFEIHNVLRIIRVSRCVDKIQM